MCGRYMLEPGEIGNDAIEAQRQAARAIQGWPFEPRYNIAPQQQILTFTGTSEGRQLQVMRWGVLLAGSTMRIAPAGSQSPHC